mgnify:CR=1 FL=1
MPKYAHLHSNARPAKAASEFKRVHSRAFTETRTGIYLSARGRKTVISVESPSVAIMAGGAPSGEGRGGEEGGIRGAADH